MMTVGELREILEGLDDETEVRFAHQPNWPFELSIGAHCLGLERNTAGDDVDVLYLTEGHQIGYLPDAVSAALGWGG